MDEEINIEGLVPKTQFVAPALGPEKEAMFPLDVGTKKTFRELFVVPVTVNLQGTSAATGANYGVFFTNNNTHAWVVDSISEVHTTAGNDAGTVSLQIERLQGTEAPDAGDVLLSTVINLKETANTVQVRDYSSGLIADRGLLIIYPKDRLCLKDIGTLTTLAGVQVTIYLKYA